MSSMGDKSDNVRSDLRTNTEPSEPGSKNDVSPSVTQALGDEVDSFGALLC